MAKLDRTAFRIQSFRQASFHRKEWLAKPPAERWADSAYLIASAWGYDPENPPRMDKTCFSIRTNGE